MRDFYNNTIIPELENLQQIANNLGIPFGISGCSVSSFKTVTLKSTKTLVSQRCNSLIYTLECEKSILKDIQRTLGTLRYTSLPIYDELSNTIYDIENSQDNYNAFKSRFDDYFKEVCNFNEKVNNFMGAYDVPEKYEQISYQNFQKQVQYQMKFYQNIPYKLKFYISLNDLKATDDGFVICTKSMDDIMKNAGLTKDAIKSSCDDWYLSGVFSDDELVYTVIKVREVGDTETLGISVPFISFDIDRFSELISKENLTDADKNELKNTIEYVRDTSADCNKVLSNYFANPESNGSYLIADLIIDKTLESATFDENGTLQFTNEYDKNDSYAKKYLDVLSKKGIYNKETQKITISSDSRNKLSEEEYNAILMTVTGDTDVYAFAAENQWHAKAINGDDLFWSWDLFDEHTIISDAGVGESKYGFLYEADFKDQNGACYKEQKKYHESR